jgi:hypothetical protein
MHAFRKTALAAAACAALATPAFADEPLVSIHGFGNQDYLRSGDTGFLGSNSHGTWQNDDLGLVLRGTVNDKVHLNAMIQADATEPVQMLWYFVDWQLSDALTLKAGRVKMPLGIYNEYIDTRGLQLAALTPLMYYDAIDIVHDAYQGVGLDYDYALGHYGKLTAQLYFGNTPNSPAPYAAPAFNSPQGTLEADTNDLHLFGYRFTWETPVDGLRLLASGYDTKTQTTNAFGQQAGVVGNESLYILSADYTTETLDIKSEFAHHHFPALVGTPGLTSSAWYVQGGYHIGAWTPYARYDSVTADTAHSGDPSYYQHTFVLGIDRLLAPNLHVRAEDHLNHGYAMSVFDGDTAAGTGKTDWSLLAVQINYMF